MKGNRLFYIDEYKKNTGLSLVELSIVLIVVGVIIAATIPSLRVHYESKKYMQSIENLEMSNNALKRYYALNGRYPCPADPAMQPNDPDYGVERCRPNPYDTSPCIGGGVECQFLGARDADADGFSDRIVIGALPYKTIMEGLAKMPYSAKYVVDGYGKLLTYAVTEEMTRGDLYNILNPVSVQLGAIPLRDENDNTLVYPPDSAHYVLVSHGRNMRGAYTPDGQNTGDCDILATSFPYAPLPPGNNITTGGIPLEKENCDRDDAIFVKGLYTLVDGDDYFDDLVFFNTQAANGLWREALNSPFGETYLYNTNFGNIGVGTTTPANKLDVDGGDLRAEVATHAEGGFCDGATSAGCMDPEALASYQGMETTDGDAECPTGKVAYGIEDNKLMCKDLFTTPLNGTCPTTPVPTYAVGIEVKNGVPTLICEPHP